MGMVTEGGNPVHVTGTTTIHTPGGTLLGFYVASTTAGTIVLREGGGSGTAISGTITPAVGFHRFPAAFGGNLHVTVGGALNATFFVVPG